MPWLDVGATNRWKMFDAAVGSQSSLASPLTVVIDPGQVVQGLALLDVEAASVRVTMTDGAGGPTVYDRTWNMIDGTSIADWFDYFFAPIEPKDTLIVSDLPLYPAGRLTVTATGSGTVKIGTLALGTLVAVGEVHASPSVGVIDYSRKETDIYGVTTVIERSYARRMDLDVTVDNGRVDYLARMLATVRATPVVWIGDDRATCLVVYGFVRDWGLHLVYADTSEGHLTIEGLT
jgi:hypothetical protein